MVSKNYNIKTFTQVKVNTQLVFAISVHFLYLSSFIVSYSYWHLFQCEKGSIIRYAILLTFDLEVHACSSLKLDLMPWNGVDSGSSMLE